MIPHRRPWSRRRLRADDGTVTAFVVVFTLALLLLAGLVLDGGLTLAVRIRAIDDAQAAARAGAQALDLTAYRATGQVTLDPTQAAAAAQTYLATARDRGVVTVTGDRVSVTVTVTQRMQLLSLAGLHSITVSGTGTARAAHGVARAEP